MSAFLQIDNKLGRRFYTHLAAINNDIEPVKGRALWQDIARRYNETQRAYHTLQHIQQLFVQFDQIKHRLYEPHIIALALSYHDVIYEPTRADNELKSAEYAVESLSPYLTAEQCQHIHALIMITANHQIEKVDDCSDKNKDNAKEKESDAAYLLDMDLSILGTSWAEYEQYAQAIRQEYVHVSNADYRAGRIAVLTGLLAHPALYLSDYYHSRLEEQARHNIQREIKILHAS